MITIPSSNDLDVVVQRMRGSLPAGGTLLVDTAALEVVFRGAHRAAGIADGTGSLLNAAEAMILGAVAQTPCSSLDSRYLAVALARELVAMNDFAFRPQLRLRDLGGIDLRGCGDETLQAIRDLLARRIVLTATELPPPDLHARGLVLSEPVRIFVGCAVSHVDVGDVRNLEQLVACIQDRLLELGVSAYVAIAQATPAHDDTMHDPYDPVVAVQDTDALHRADCVVAVHDRPSTGLGINIERGQAGGAFTIFVEPGILRSPLTAELGYGLDVIEIPYGTAISDGSVDIACKVAGCVQQHMSSFEEHRRRRLRRHDRYADRLNETRSAAASFAGSGLPQRRVDEMLRSVDSWANATTEEHRILADSLGLGTENPGRTGRRSFTADEIGAALIAARENGWSDERTASVLERASSFILAGHHRALWTDPSFWERFRRDQGL